MNAPYKLTAYGWINRIADNQDIPPDPTNVDYQAFLAWVAAGNTPDPAQ